jgi:hypothetical protein
MPVDETDVGKGNSSEDFEILIDLLASDGIGDIPDDAELDIRDARGQLDASKVRSLFVLRTPADGSDVDQEDASVLAAPPSDRPEYDEPSPAFYAQPQGPDAPQNPHESSQPRLAGVQRALIPHVAPRTRSAEVHVRDEHTHQPRLPILPRSKSATRVRPARARIQSPARLADSRAAHEFEVVTALTSGEISELRMHVAQVRAMATSLHGEDPAFIPREDALAEPLPYSTREQGDAPAFVSEPGDPRCSIWSPDVHNEPKSTGGSREKLPVSCLH